jgi:GNAT superfamily N-acetyltransferase
MSKWILRHGLLPGDLGAIVQLHGQIYAQEYGFDSTFEAYVAGPLAEFVLAFKSRERTWIAEHNSEIIGCIAIVEASPTEAQLRWFLVQPSARGQGLGKALIDTAIDFGKSQQYESIFLWTVSALTSAAHLYEKAGFRKVEELPGRRWGVEVVEERYVLGLRPEED